MAVRKQKYPAQEAGQVPNENRVAQAEAPQERPGASLPALTCTVNINLASLG